MTSPDQNYTSWHVGMRVVCVDDSNDGRHSLWPVDGGIDGLKAQNIYTVRSIGDFRGVLCVWLKEIRRPIRTVHGEPGYSVRRFRPVQTRKTDISVFTAMLSPKPAKAGKVRA